MLQNNNRNVWSQHTNSIISRAFFREPPNPPASQANISAIAHPKNSSRPSNVLPKPKSNNATTMKVAIPSTSSSSPLINNSVQNCAKTCTITSPNSLNSSNSSAKSPKPRPPPKPSKDVVERALANNGTNASRNGIEKSNGKTAPATKPKPKVAENVKKVPDNPKSESEVKRTVVEDQRPGTSESMKNSATMKLEPQSLNSRSARSQGRPKVVSWKINDQFFAGKNPGKAHFLSFWSLEFNMAWGHDHMSWRYSTSCS